MSETKRVRRTPINGIRNKLTVAGKDADKEYRFVTDTDDNLTRFKEKGWEMVPKDKVTVGDKRVADPSDMGSIKQIKNRNGDIQYLMCIPKEWKAEDDAAKQAEIDKIERALYDEPEAKGLKKYKL